MKRSPWEYIFVFVIIVCAIVCTLYVYNDDFALDKKKRLRHELEQIRDSIQVYKFINKKNPASLSLLVDDEFKFDRKIKHKYIHGIRSDGNNYLVDPFGVLYLYDPKTGFVRSGTVEYSTW